MADRKIEREREISVEKITWNDAYSTDEWTHVDDLRIYPAECVSIGYVVKETKDLVCLAGTVQVEDADVCCVIHIPKGCIVKREAIEWI